MSEQKPLGEMTVAEIEEQIRRWDEVRQGAREQMRVLGRELDRRATEEAARREWAAMSPQKQAALVAAMGQPAQVISAGAVASAEHVPTPGA